MPMIIELKRYLINKTQQKFNLTYEGAKGFVNTIEKQKGLTGYEEQLEKSQTYAELFNHYFDTRCVLKEA